MAIGFFFEVPQTGREQYDEVMEKLGPHAPGRLYHVAGPSRDSDAWMVFDLWESQEAFEAFLSERLLPVARQVGFFSELPRSFTLYKVIEGQD
jgi:quinol monooxygenase YgiN